MTHPRPELSEARTGDSAEFLGEARRVLLPQLIPPLVHRLNNALAVLHGVDDSAVSVPPSDLAHREFVSARSVLSHLAILAKFTASRTQTFDARELGRGVERLLGPFAEKLGVALEWPAPQVIVPLEGDPSRLEQLVVTLVANEMLDAVAGLAEGGARPRVRFSLKHGSGRVSLCILRPRSAENEDGPSALWREAIAWVEDLGAGVFRRSMGSMTCFRIVFPAPHATIRAFGEPAALESAEPGARLLLVEEDESLRELIATVLSEGGYRVVTRGPSEFDPRVEGLEMELILLDSDVEVDRPGLVRKLDGDPEMRQRLLVLGEPHYPEPIEAPVLRKPFRPHELLAAVRQRLAGTRERDAVRARSTE